MHLDDVKREKRRVVNTTLAVFTAAILTYLIWNFVILEIVGIAIGFLGRTRLLELEPRPTNASYDDRPSTIMSESWRDMDMANPTEEHSMLREMVRNFVRDRVEPQALENDREERFNIGLFREMGSMGLLGLTVPRVRWRRDGCNICGDS